MALVTAAPGDRRHMAERVFYLVRRELVLRAQQLSAVDFSGSQKTRDHADQYRRQENIPLGIVHLFRQRRNAVEPNVGQYRD